MACTPVVMAIAACNFFCASCTSSLSAPNNSIAPVNAANPPDAPAAKPNTASKLDVSDAMRVISSVASLTASRNIAVSLLNC